MSERTAHLLDLTVTSAGIRVRLLDGLEVIRPMTLPEMVHLAGQFMRAAGRRAKLGGVGNWSDGGAGGVRNVRSGPPEGR